MLAYAPRPDATRLRPATLGLIILGHAGLLALVMTARSGTIPHNPFKPTVVVLVPEPKPPSPTEPKTAATPSPSTFTNVKPVMPPPIAQGPTVAVDPIPLPPLGTVASTGTGFVLTPIPLDPPIVRTGPRFATSDDAIRPPYPDSMRATGAEASLRLRLSIDARGRVVAVDPVGRADPTFLAVARRHILRAWRYQPAMDGAKAVPSTTTITLKFELGAD